MKEWILIAIGGSGARVAQSVVALAAAGFPAMLGQQDARLTIRLVDLDVHHADGQELRDMIKSYNCAFGFLWQKGKAWCEKWRPFEIVLEDEESFFFQTGLNSGDDNTTKIMDFVPTLGNHEGSKLLMKALYSAADRDMDLLQGCKGRPRIGSLLWEYLYRNRGQNFWSTLCTLAGGQDETRVMFAGSLFGGTGASGVPTLARLFKQSLEQKQCLNYRIGMTLMAPYFYLQDDPKKRWGKGEVKADFANFPFQSKMALNYYLTSDILSGVDYVQVVGNNEQSMKEEDSEGKQHEVMNSGDSVKSPQNNPSVPTELTAAVGVFEFFAGAGGNTVVVPEKEQKSGWGSFPQAEQVRTSLQQLERLCLMTESYYGPIAVQAKEYRPAAVNELWYEQTRSSEGWEDVWTSRKSGIGDLIFFSEEFLRWFSDMDVNGLKPLEVMENKNNLQAKAQRGKTSGVNLLGMKLRLITGAVNEQAAGYLLARKHLDRQNPGAEAFTLALLGACEAKRPPKAATIKHTAANA
ncbi:MAG TPA: hypothetical protein P5075_00120 [Eubacteriales bacterium]|nr:hypothetical protein [Eubacteriales bacterium]